MDVGPMVNMIRIGTIAIICIVIVRGILTSRPFKGWLGEFLVRRLAMAQLDAEKYHQLHDVTLPTTDGTTQIDHIIVSKYGVFVIETKNMGGWIFGDPNNPKWTQTFGKSKNSFQNPLRQNYKHIKELESLLQIGEDKLFSMVAFTGNAEFKTVMPDNVMPSNRLIRYILSKTAPILSEREVQDILLRINGSMMKKSRETSELHVRNLNRKFGNNAEEISRQKQRNLIKISVAFGIVLIVMFILNQLKSQTRPPAPLTAITEPNTAQQVTVISRQQQPQKPIKAPRSDEFGILSLTAKKDTYLTLYDANNVAVIQMEIKKGQNEEVEIRKGFYKAEILQAGQREISTVSFIGKTGALEF